MSEGIAAGIAAYERNDWKAGYELLSEAIAGTLDDATALDALAECCWWLEHVDEAIEHRERAYAIHYRNGDWSKAAGAALKLGGAYANARQQPAVAAGWRQRASELLDGKPLSAAHLQLKLGIAQRMTDVDGCLPLIDEVIGLAQQLGDHDEEMLAIGLKGLKLVDLGRVDEGLPLQEAALAAAVGGELTPLSTVLAYCWLISSCDNLGDIERANEWSDTALRYCDRAAIPSFPGVCRLHRSRMLRLRGAWDEAEAEAFRAAGALGTMNPGGYALALCEVAELRRRRGDVEGARDVARQAVAMGRTPQVALARIEWEADGPEAAMYRLESVLHGPITDRFARARLIPTFVEAAIACGKAESAEEHVAELESLAEVGHTNVLRGAARGSRGRLQHARQDLVGARAALEAAVAAWSAAEVPYEGARDRLALAAVLLASGNRAGARSEAQEAQRVLADLGAEPEARHAETFIAGLQRSKPSTMATMLFVDIVDSTPLVEAIGDAAWRDLCVWLDATLRRAFAEHRGREVDHAGDGFFVVFPTARDAVDCAVTVQRRLFAQRKEQGYAPRVRIGIHAGDAIESDGAVRGAAVHRAARISAIASADEIVASRVALEAAGLATTAVRAVTLKGVRDEVEVGVVAWSPLEIGGVSPASIGQDIG